MPIFVSPFLHKMAWATDALSISWNGIWAYAFPLLPLIPKVLQKICENTEVVLVALWWSSKAWSTELLELSVEPTKALPAIERLLSHPTSGIFHKNPQVFKLHAWRLLYRALNLLVSQKKWQNELLEANLTKII